MKAIVCISNNEGMMFHHRRQSMDREVRKEILSYIGNHRLFMNAYTAGQFEKVQEITVSEQHLEEAGEEDYCFVEDDSLKAYEDKIDELILFRWNRDYPADLFLEIEYRNWELVEQKEIIGYSHENITMEVWMKNETAERG